MVKCRWLLVWISNEKAISLQTVSMCEMSYPDLSTYRFKQGDKKVFRQLFEEYYPRLCCFALKYMKDEQTSEDIVQEVMSDLWDKRQSINVKISLKAFLYASVKNRCLNQLKKSVSDEQKLSDYLSVESESIDDFNYIQEEVHANLYKAINSLPEKSREVVILSMREMSNAEITEELDISVNTVKSNKKRAYRMLREMLR